MNLLKVSYNQVPFKTCLPHDLHHTYTLMPIANMQCDMNKEEVNILGQGINLSMQVM